MTVTWPTAVVPGSPEAAALVAQARKRHDPALEDRAGARARNAALRSAQRDRAPVAPGAPVPDVGAQAPPHMRDRLLSLDGLGSLPPVRPLVDGLLYRNTLAQIAGPPGSYKSFVAVGMACAVATGRNWEGHRVPEAGPVVYVAAEGASGLRTRVLAWCESNGVDPAELDGRLYFLAEPVQLGNTADVSQACDVARELSALLLVLDTRARCTLGLSENDATEQGRAIHHAEAIQKAAGTTVLGVHHTGRGGDHGRGSNAWDGAVWSDLRLTGEDRRCRIHCEKHKDVPAGCDHDYRLVPHAVSPELLPRLPNENDSEWQSRRSTLVSVQNGIGTNDLDERRSTRVVRDVIGTTAGDEGLTRAQIVQLCEEQKLSRTAVYEAVRVLTATAILRNVGTPHRARYVLAGMTLSQEQQ